MSRRRPRCAGPAPHFGGDHGKALARLARPRRLDPGIERQQVGLEGDPVDHPDDLGNLARGAFDCPHRLDRPRNDRPALLGLAKDLRGLAARIGGGTAVWRAPSTTLCIAAVVSSTLAARRVLRMARSCAALWISPMVPARLVAPTRTVPMAFISIATASL
jgi:hypothetical protein